MGNQNFKILSLVLGVVLVLSLGANFILSKKDNFEESPNDVQDNLEANAVRNVKTIEKASAEEIYPLFECSCCGKAINECSCGMAKERMAFIDGITTAEISKDEVILIYIKKYGLSSFMDKEKEGEFREKLAKEAPADRPIISLDSNVYDFGDVSQKKGTVITFFEIKNNGKSDLEINRLETSCGCTSASIVYQDEEGPKFNMPGHGINEEIGDWQISIAPGATAQLKVYYDPDMHKDFRGAVTRDIYIYSNDPIDFQKKVQIELNQVP